MALVDTIYVESSGAENDVRIDTWLKDILPRTPGIVRKVAQREFILAAREFYEQSTAWRAVMGPLDIKDSKYEYRLSPFDAYSDVLRVLWASFRGVALNKLYCRPGKELETGENPHSYWVDPPDTLNIVPIPQSDFDDSLYVYVALIPKRNIRHLPGIAERFHYDALLDGALSRIYSHPAKPYTNKDLAQYHGNRFRSAIGKYAAQAKEGYTNAPAWSFPGFGK